MIPLRTKYLKPFAILLYSGILLFVIWSQFIDKEEAINIFLFICSMMIVSIPIIYFVSNKLLSDALRYHDKKKFMLILLMALVVLPTLCLIIVYLLQLLESMQVFSKDTAVTQYIEKPFWIRFARLALSSLHTVGIFCSLSFLSEYFILSDEKKELEIKNITTQKAYLEEQLKVLKNQINPHTMFNILNHIHILMQENIEIASDLLIKFSEVLRYQLYECNHQLVSLKKEIKYLKDYIAVEQMRWGDQIVVEYDEQIVNDSIEINPLLFIPFVENAFKFVGKQTSKKGVVKIKFTQTHNTLSFNIENTVGSIKGKTSDVGGIGIENVRKRLDILYNGSYVLNIDKTDCLYKVDLLINIS